MSNLSNAQNAIRNATGIVGHPLAELDRVLALEQAVTLDEASGGGGGGTPGLPFNSVQFNNAGALGGSALFEFDGTQVTTPVLNVMALDSDFGGIYIESHSTVSDMYSAYIYSLVKPGVAATNVWQLWVDAITLGAGASLENAYGLYIYDQTAATNNWAIKTGKGLVDLGDRTIISAAIPVTAPQNSAGLTINATDDAGGHDNRYPHGLYVSLVETPTTALTGYEDAVAGEFATTLAGTQNFSELYGVATTVNNTSSGTLNAMYGASIGLFTGAGSGNVAGVVGVDVYWSFAGGGVDAYKGIWIETPNVISPATVATAYGIKIEDQAIATTNYAIKTGKGLVEFGAAGDAAGTVGLHIMGHGAFSDPSNTQLWLDSDAADGYNLLITNRTKGISHYSGVYVGTDGAFVIDADGGNGRLKYSTADDSWNLYTQGGLVNVPGLFAVGAAGDTAGTSGLHIMGKGAFDSDSFGNPAMLWLDGDTNQYTLAMTNRTAGVGKYSSFQIQDDGSFELDVSGGFGILQYHAVSNDWELSTGGGTVKVPSLTTIAATVATLPASPVAGQRAFVTDSNAVSFTAGIGAVVAAGGSTKVPCVYDGTNWRIG